MGFVHRWVSHSAADVAVWATNGLVFALEGMTMEPIEGHTAHDQGGACRSTGACLFAICRLRAEPGARVNGEDAQTFGGHCRCECGQESPHLFSNRERRNWHRHHKSLMVVPVGGLL